MKIFMRDTTLILFFVFLLPHIAEPILRSMMGYGRSAELATLLVLEISMIIIVGVIYGYIKKPYRLKSAIGNLAIGSFIFVVGSIIFFLVSAVYEGNMTNLDGRAVVASVLITVFSFFITIIFLSISYVVACTKCNIEGGSKKRL